MLTSPGWHLANRLHARFEDRLDKMAAAQARCCPSRSSGLRARAQILRGDDPPHVVAGIERNLPGDSAHRPLHHPSRSCGTIGASPRSWSNAKRADARRKRVTKDPRLGLPTCKNCVHLRAKSELAQLAGRSAVSYKKPVRSTLGSYVSVIVHDANGGLRERRIDGSNM